MFQKINNLQVQHVKPASVRSDIIEQYAAFDALHIPFPWTQTQWLNLNDNYFLIEVRNQKGELTGLMLLHHVDGDHYMHLLKIAVAMGERRSGVGKLMMNQMLRRAREMLVKTIGLEVDTNNNSAIDLYQQFNAKFIQHKKCFYSDGTDAHVMHIELSVIG
jgi:ribosomal protein S18 acetylase RimI-like enzyme